MLIFRKNKKTIRTNKRITQCYTCPCCCPWGKSWELIEEFCPCYELYNLFVSYISENDIWATNNSTKPPDREVPQEVLDIIGDDESLVERFKYFLNYSIDVAFDPSPSQEAIEFYKNDTVKFWELELKARCCLFYDRKAFCEPCNLVPPAITPPSTTTTTTVSQVQNPDGSWTVTSISVTTDNNTGEVLSTTTVVSTAHMTSLDTDILDVTVTTENADGSSSTVVSHTESWPDGSSSESSSSTVTDANGNTTTTSHSSSDDGNGNTTSSTSVDNPDGSGTSTSSETTDDGNGNTTSSNSGTTTNSDGSSTTTSSNSSTSTSTSTNGNTTTTQTDTTTTNTTTDTNSSGTTTTTSDTTTTTSETIEHTDNEDGTSNTTTTTTITETNNITGESTTSTTTTTHTTGVPDKAWYIIQRARWTYGGIGVSYIVDELTAAELTEFPYSNNDWCYVLPSETYYSTEMEAQAAIVIMGYADFNAAWPDYCAFTWEQRVILRDGLNACYGGGYQLYDPCTYDELPEPGIWVGAFDFITGTDCCGNDPCVLQAQYDDCMAACGDEDYECQMACEENYTCWQ